MKCPKCGYLGFEHVDRCRNCGYDFSLTAPATLPELPLRPRSVTPRPLDDLALLDEAVPPEPATPLSDIGPDLDRLLGVPPVQPLRATREELPLFGSPIPDDEPLIRKPSPPRPPLAVRRATPEVARLRAEHPPPRLQALDLPLDSDPGSPVPPDLTSPLRLQDGAGTLPADEAGADATVSSRLLAVVIDLLILGGIDAVVIYLTLQVCGITVRDLGIVPKGPLLAFLLVQNGGYLVAFTAGGQTLGKMAAGIRVVSTESDAALDFGRAFLRTAMWVVLAVPAGLGFLSALFNRDHRGLHDHFAGTRVVR